MKTRSASLRMPARTRKHRAILCALALTLAPQVLLAQVSEVEPNESKATATLAVLAAGGTITGTSTGTSTAVGGGIGTTDYFLVRTNAAPLGIYRNDLTFSSTSNLNSAIMTLRGLTQSSSVINPSSDTSFHFTNQSIAPIHTLRWYGFGKQEQVYVEFSGANNTTTPYTGTLSTTTITPTPLVGTVGSGDVTIRITAGSAPAVTDPEVWLYDANLNPVPNGNNNNSTTNFPILKRSLSPGVYYLAVSDTSIANNLATPLDDSIAARSHAVLDFPDVLARNSSNTSPRNYVLTISSPGAADIVGNFVSPVTYSEVQWFTFTIVPQGPCIPGTPYPILSTGSDTTGTFNTVPVAVSGTTAIIGNPLDDANSLTDSGSASVFVKSGNRWVEQARLADATILASELAGTSVAISGDTAVIGAPGALSGAGRIHVFVRNGVTWTRQASLVPAENAAGDAFGTHVAINGDTIVVGAPLADPLGLSSGAAYVFSRSGTTWFQQARLLANEGSTTDEFGRRVAVFGDTAVVGASEDAAIAGNDAGSAYVFARSAGTWTQTTKLVPADAFQSDRFGASVAVSADTIAIGAYGCDLPSILNVGAVYVYRRVAGAWTQEAKLFASDAASGDTLGYSVSLNGDTLITGSYLDDTNAGSNAGSAYVFSRSGTSWSQVARFGSPDPLPSAQFGESVGVDGPLTVVGGIRPGVAVGWLFETGTPGIDGTCEACYGGALATQSTQTSAGNSTANDLNLAEGSELSGLHARIIDGTLYLTLTGNLESTSGKLELFFDTTAGGQNTLGTNIPSVAYGGLTRMAGMTFDTGFSPDYYFTVAGGSQPAFRQVDIASLPTTGTGTAQFLGYIDYSADGSLTGGFNPNNIRVAINNSNTGGITAGIGVTNPPTSATSTGPLTGVEVAIPLVALGNPTCDLKVLAFVNGDNHASVSNQFLPPIPARAALGDPRFVNLANIPDLQFATARQSPSFLSQPLGISTCSGTNATFAVSTQNASGFQWRRNGVNLTNGAGVAGVATATLILTGVSASSAGAYDCVISGACGSPVTSTPAPLTVDDVYSGAPPASITAFDAANSDVFGYGSISFTPISGDTLVIGAALDDTPAGIDAGSVYVYTRSGTAWNFQQKLTASDGAAGDVFGGSWAIDGDYIVVGANSDDTATGTNAGSAYVFFRSAGVWTQQAKLEPSAAAAQDNFGFAVAISGTRIVVGAPNNDNGITTNVGSAYVFVRSGTVWTQESTTLFPSDGTANDNAGQTVAISGDTIAIGAPNEGNVGFASLGAVYVFTRSGSVWNEQQKVFPSDRNVSDQAGYGLSLFGDNLVIGAPGRDDSGTDSGAVYYFTRTGGLWSQRQKITPSGLAAGDIFGFSSGMTATRLIVGAPSTDLPGFANAGAAYVFNLQSGLFVLSTRLSSPTPGVADQAATVVGISGDTAVMTVGFDDYGAFTDAGSALVHYLRHPLEDVTVASGATANFPLLSPPPAGANAFFQWRKGGFPVANGPTGTGSTISGATTNTLSIAAAGASDVGTYDCIITNNCSTYFSRAANLAITGGLPIVASPHRVIACRGTRNVIIAGDLGADLPDLSWQARNLAVSDEWIPVSEGPFSSGLLHATIAFSPDHRELWFEGNWHTPSSETLSFRCVSMSTNDPDMSMPAELVVCPADANCSGGVSVQDVFDFLADWFMSDPVRGNMNGDCCVTVQDIFDFLAAWFAGC